MFRIALAALAGILLANTPNTSTAEPRATLGIGRIFSNDRLGDGQDRWRTGSYSLSILRGPDWQGRAPDGLGRLLEFRFRNDILTPSDLGAVGSEDRPYAGILSAGVHTHAAYGAYDVSLGADLVLVGPQTGVGDLHTWWHEQTSAPRPSVTETQIGDAVYLDATAELSRTLRLTGGTSLRGFLEGRLGTEDTLRLGADVMIGPFLHDEMLIRDATTGHLYRGTGGDGSGFAFVLGGDVARVWDSEWLPEAEGYAAEDTRTRLRGGLHWQFSRDVSFFYGATYLSEEFEGQPEGQVLGSLKLNFNF